VVAGRFDTFKGDQAPHKHGTAMASAIAAHGRLLGVAPAAHILAVRAFDDAPAGRTPPPPASSTGCSGSPTPAPAWST
jgi:hypothetical protein